MGTHVASTRESNPCSSKQENEHSLSLFLLCTPRNYETILINSKGSPAYYEVTKKFEV
jgi:hypothetical protein